MSFITIIIPVFNDSVRLFKLLKHLKFQTLSKEYWDVIVVDNNSDNYVDLPEDIIIPYKIKFLKEVTPGSYSARNRGVKNAKGNILAFTDSDCLPSADWLQIAYDYFLKDENFETGILTGPVPLFYKNPKSLSDAEIYEKYTGFTTESYAKEGHAITANWFSPTSVIKEFGGFDNKLKSNGDSELSGRISKKYKIVYSQDLIVHHPARYHTSELVGKYKRLMGGTFSRRFQGKNLTFFKHVGGFVFRRYRFFIKRLFTIPMKESKSLWKVCNAINYGVFQEYISLIKGNDTKR